MNYLYYGTFLANLALAIAGLCVQSKLVAVQFDFGGHPTSWALRESAATLALGTTVLLFVILQASWTLIVKLPPKLVNLPHKDYWLREENPPAAKARYTICIRSLGTVVFAFLLYLGAFTLQANLSETVKLNPVAPWVGLWLLGSYLIYWIIRFHRMFRIPGEQNVQDSDRPVL